MYLFILIFDNLIFFSFMNEFVSRNYFMVIVSISLTQYSHVSVLLLTLFRISTYPCWTKWVNSSLHPCVSIVVYWEVVLLELSVLLYYLQGFFLLHIPRYLSDIAESVIASVHPIKSSGWQSLKDSIKVRYFESNLLMFRCPPLILTTFDSL